MEDDDDNSGGGGGGRGGGGGEMSLFEAFSTKAKATRTLGTYNDKNRKLVKFAAGSDEFKAKVDLSKDLNRQITLFGLLSRKFYAPPAPNQQCMLSTRCA